jgi:hypothetical protein
MPQPCAAAYENPAQQAEQIIIQPATVRPRWRWPIGILVFLLLGSVLFLSIQTSKSKEQPRSWQYNDYRSDKAYQHQQNMSDFLLEDKTAEVRKQLLTLPAFDAQEKNTAIHPIRGGASLHDSSNDTWPENSQYGIVPTAQEWEQFINIGNLKKGK